MKIHITEKEKECEELNQTIEELNQTIEEYEYEIDQIKSELEQSKNEIASENTSSSHIQSPTRNYETELESHKKIILDSEPQTSKSMMEQP